MTDAESNGNKGKHVLQLDYKLVTQSTPFTSQGMDALSNRILGYADELILESSKNAKRQAADDISASHVEAASKYLVSSNPGSRIALAGSFGGLLVGAAISQTVSIFNGDQTKPMTTVLTVALGLVGSFLMALQLARR